MAWLLIDNSNSRTKLGIGLAEGLTTWRAVIPTDQLNEETLTEALKDISYQAVTIASVVPKAALILQNFFRNTPLHFLSSQSPLGYECQIPEPGKVGADRLANLAALKENYGYPAVAIDFGTAVTFSALSEQGHFIGGAIAPGMDLFVDYFPSKTAQLPRITVSEPHSAIGSNTLDAILAGAVYGHRGMVKEIISKMIHNMKPATPYIVATGGGAEFGFTEHSVKSRIDLNLTLEGIRLISKRFFCPKVF